MYILYKMHDIKNLLCIFFFSKTQQMKEMSYTVVAESQVPNHISIYSLDTNIQFILNSAPNVYRTCNTILN